MTAHARRRHRALVAIPAANSRRRLARRGRPFTPQKPQPRNDVPGLLAEPLQDHGKVGLELGPP